MRNIIVVEAISTGINFVTDIVHRGYHPVVLELAAPEGSDISAMREASYSLTGDPFETIAERESYEETLELVKSYDPVLVLAGSEDGVVMTAKLVSDLGLPGNQIANIDKMTKKSAMHEALKEAGLRYIKGEVFTEPEAALAFCRSNGLTKAVVKPLQSAGSQGLFLCDSLDEVKDAAEKLLTMNDVYGYPIRSAIVQERINGTEYVVNTMSCGGRHRVSSFFRYKKVKTDEGGYIYDCMENIYRLEPGHNALIEYALKTADAIGIKYGSVHGEYMIDEHGPVLIEVNCRPMGGTMPAGFLDLMYGQHETDSVLDCYLAPEKFAADAVRPYRPMRQGYIKFIRVPADMEAETLPIWTIAENLRSTFLISTDDRYTIRSYVKTRDLETAGGSIFMVHDDKAVADADLKLLSMIEDRYFSYIFNDGMSRRWFYDKNAAETTCSEFEKLIHSSGSTLLVSDRIDACEGAMTVSPENADNITYGFDQIILDIGDWITGVNEVSCLEKLFSIMKKVKPGSRVIITEHTWQYLSYQRDGAELLFNVLGYILDMPVQGQDRSVSGVKC